jgi:hypothetical protein
MPTRRATVSNSGFVLVGVVVLVLALSILVLSLYGLSSYEAQFLQRSLDEEQAFQSAVGGIERAKFALTRTSQLQSVKDALPIENVTAAVAIQDHGSVSDSVGPVNWQGTDVTIRVTAKVNGAQRTVEGRFSLVVTLSYYSSLITVSDGIEVVTVAPPGYLPNDRDHTVLLDGPIWESSGRDTSGWLDHLRSPVPVGIRTWPAVPDSVPLPDVDPFLTPGRINAALSAVNSEPPDENPIYTLDASGTIPGVPAYFRAEDEGGGSPYSLDTESPVRHSSCTIQVRGLAVWLLPRGARFYQGTVITGVDPSTDCLVIIAGLNTGPASIYFRGYLHADIPVILVSSGKVSLWHLNDYDASTFTNDLAIFARSTEFMGPDPTRGVLQLHRDPNGTGPLNTLFLDALAAKGALPNATSASGRRLDLVPGTWRASD